VRLEPRRSARTKIRPASDPRRTVTLNLDPPRDLSLGETLARLDTAVVPKLREAMRPKRAACASPAAPTA
jgi:hypothetical protein